MYNRYIPPPKEPKPVSTAPVSKPVSSSQPYARYIPPLAPKAREQPSPAQPRRTVFDDADAPTGDTSDRRRTTDEELTGAIENEEPERSRPEASQDGAGANGAPGSGLKSRKRKRGEAESAEQDEEDLPEGSGAAREVAESASQPALTASIPASEAVPSGTVNKKPKPKREKKKKRKQESTLNTDAADDDADDFRRRHKSVFEKIERSLQLQSLVDQDGDVNGEERSGDADKEEAEPQVEHGLEPLPQPEPVVFDESKLTYETLPPWLASPIRVDPDTRRDFTELGIPPESSKVLESRGFKDAFAVQTAVLPLLLPSPDRQGDVVVAAPTGSGKTLSYVLPMVHDISKGRVTRLRGLIVLPTRDLVQQVQLACEACAAAFAVGGGKRVKVGTAMGNRVFKEEQTVIMGEEQRYDPDGYERYLQRQDKFVSLEESDEEEDDDLDLERSEPLPYHVVSHTSKVDILICTPGRLVEHISKTPGFTLDYVRWLIVDEADKLLAQDFQQWLDTVTEKLAGGKPGARDFPSSNKTGVRKVILSATMTRDISLLNELKLSRPKLVLVEGTKAGEQSLPALLKEYAIKVREPSLKPLYLVDLLHSKHMVAVNDDGAATEATAESESSDAESSCSSDSSSTAESESDSDSDSDSASSSSPSSDDDGARKPKAKSSASAAAATRAKFDTTVLIFTKSNEAALRLSRLLALLAPDLAPYIGTLTSSTRTARRTRTLRAFERGRVRVLVASDLVSRGIDLARLEHVVNYDVPASETAYVHRVGRTARAGRRGCAWTLVEHAEAWRFWKEFAGEGKGASTSIVRKGKVERVRIGGEEGGEFSDERIREYELALARLQREAGESRK